MCTSYRCEWLAWRSKAEELMLEASEEERSIELEKTEQTEQTNSRDLFLVSDVFSGAGECGRV
jgi:hypothetical protein